MKTQPDPIPPDAGALPPAASTAAARRCLGADGRLSVLMPAFRLGSQIAENIRIVHRHLQGRIPFEIVLVDDGSDDQTRSEIERVAQAMPELRPIFLERNVGKGAALRRGFEHATGTHILLLDADLDLGPDQTWVFFDVMAAQAADIVIGSKLHPESRVDYPWSRRVVSRVYYTLVKLLVGLPVRDTQTGMKLFRREALQYVFERMLVKRFAFDLEILSIAHNRGFKVVEAPVRIDFGKKIGCLSWQTVREVMTDTLAVFYRLRWLRYYQSVEPVRMPNPPPTVSVVIACPGDSPTLRETLRECSRQSIPPLEILVLPDREPSGWPPPPGVTVQATGPVRPAEKRNLGIRRARGDIVAFLDDDAFPGEAWLERALPYFSKPEIAAVGGPATTPPREPFRRALSGRVFASRLVSGSVRYRYVPTRVMDVDDFPSCNLLVRRRVLETLGGFRTDFWPGEDTLLCLRITRELKMRIVYDPWVLVFHHRRALFGPHLRQVGRYALHRGCFARRFPQTSRRIGYMLPSLFVLGVTAGGLASVALSRLRPPYLGALLLYAATVGAAASHRNPRVWGMTALGIAATHVVYGFRFLQGLVTGRMPEQPAPFDHSAASGEPPPDTAEAEPAT